MNLVLVSNLAFPIFFLAVLGFAVFLIVKNNRLKANVLDTYNWAQNSVAEANKSAEERITAIQQQSQTSVAEAQKQIDQQLAEMHQEAERVRQHYEDESRKIQEAADALVAKTINDFEPLRKFEKFKDAEREAQSQLSVALIEATSLRTEAKKLLEQAQNAASSERSQAIERAKEIREQADALLNQATRDAGRIIADAEKRAEEIGGDAYVALRETQLLEQAANAMRNVVEGYGDRYIMPTHSLLDDLAVQFGYDAAGQALKSAREQARRMVEQGEAATCDYVETNRREIAIRFVIDAFNGRVDAILSRSRHDNYGILEQEIRDAFSLVNLNGQAFRNARILPSYLDARLAELKWAVVVHELERKQREEQRYLREKLRDEEKARKEYEEKMRQAAKDEELKRKALEEAEKKYAGATAEQRARYEHELQKLREELAEATQKTLTIAQQTKKGHVYIISNIGSFGEGIYKIGQTRRPDPQERIDELGDASVPFEFDIHALNESENAPSLEHKLHRQFLAMQVNKINARKEFFRVRLNEIRQEVERLNEGEDFTLKVWTDKALATEFKETLDIENDAQKKEKWLARQRAMTDRQLKLDLTRSSMPYVEKDEGNTPKDTQETGQTAKPSETEPKIGL